MQTVKLTRDDKLERLSRWLKKTPEQLNAAHQGIELHRFYRWYSTARLPVLRAVRRRMPGLRTQDLNIEELLTKLHEWQDARGGRELVGDFDHLLEGVSLQTSFLRA